MDVASKQSCYLAKNKRIIASVVHCATFCKSGEFSAQSSFNQPLFASSLGIELAFDLGVDPSVEPWHRWENRRLKEAAIFDQLQWISLVKADSHPGAQHNCKNDLLE